MRRMLVVMVAGIVAVLAGKPAAGQNDEPIVGHPEPRDIPAPREISTPQAPIEEVVTVRGVIKVSVDDTGAIISMMLMTAAGEEYHLTLEPKNRMYAEYKDREVSATGLVSNEDGILWLDIRSCNPITD